VILSPRKIHISVNGIVWNCASVAKHDSLFREIQPASTQEQHHHPDTSRTKIDPATSHLEILPVYVRWDDHNSRALKESGLAPAVFHRQLRLAQWYSFLNDFRRRKISFPRDRFPAISAIASDLKERLDLRYYAGIWLEDHARGLAWTTAGYGLPLDTWSAPSWSWASLDCTNKFPDSDESRNEEDFGEVSEPIKLIDYVKDVGIYSALTPPLSLQVEGQVLYSEHWAKHGLVQNNYPPTYRPKKYNGATMGQPLKENRSITRLWCEFDHIREGTQYCADDLEGLVLLKLGVWPPRTSLGITRSFAYALMLKGHVDTTYKRVGIAKIPENGKWRNKEWQVARLVLV
jgi:hypothetical protein